jgi:16S RNA G1207 methylase RsmC
MKNKDKILDEIIKSNKYNKINEDVINRVIDSEISKYKNDKLIIKEVKNKLHQIHGIYLDVSSNKKVKLLLEENKSNEVLKLHMSTLERLGFYEEFYESIFKITGIPDSILDLACGYNPFSIKYMNLNKGFNYYAYDINEETNELINLFFKENNYSGISKTLDLTISIPNEKVDIAFLFKFIPLVEQQNKNFSEELLNKINAEYIVISFPTKSVTGRNVGMVDNYKKLFNSIIKNNFIIVEELLFSNELVFIIKKNRR